MEGVGFFEYFNEIVPPFYGLNLKNCWNFEKRNLKYLFRSKKKSNKTNSEPFDGFLKCLNLKHSRTPHPLSADWFKDERKLQTLTWIEWNTFFFHFLNGHSAKLDKTWVLYCILVSNCPDTLYERLKTEWRCFDDS